MSPATTTKGHDMHNSYGTLLNYILLVFEKYGYKEFVPGTLQNLVHILFRIALYSICNENYIYYFGVAELNCVVLGDPLDPLLHQIAEARESSNSSASPGMVLETVRAGLRNDASILRYHILLFTFLTGVEVSIHEYFYIYVGKRLWLSTQPRLWKTPTLTPTSPSTVKLKVV